MKIFIGVDSPTLNGKIAKRFGHADYYLIYDSDNENLDVNSNSSHDEKHTILFEAINKGVKVFIVGNIGPHAFQILNKNGVKIYLARKMTAQVAIDKLIIGELELLTEPTVKKSMHHH